MRKRALSIALLLAATAVLAQESATYKLTEHVFNAGGHPSGASNPVSASYQITMGSIGDGLSARGLSSASYHTDAGFVMTYPPPGETTGLRFISKTGLAWDAEPSAGSYNLYRDLLSNLTGLGFGQCQQQGLASTTTNDAEAVPAGDGFFYLMTVENRVAEEGTKGAQSSGAERQGAACP